MAYLPKLPRIGRLLPGLILLIGLGTTQLLYRSSLTSAEQILHESFEYQTQDIMQHIYQRVDTYEHVLRGVDSLFAASLQVDRDEFRAYVSNLQLREHYPGIQGVGYAQLIPAREKSSHEQAIRLQGFPFYAIHPVEQRDYYASVVYVEPFTPLNQRALGYDMLSDATRRAAAERARDLGQPVISGKVRLLQETAAQAGFIMFLPVYRNDAPHLAVTERRASLNGWIYAAFRMDDLMQGLLSHYSQAVCIRIYDGPQASPATLMYDADEGKTQPTADARYIATRQLAVAGHTWTLDVQSLPAFEAQLNTERARSVAAIGVLASLLLALLLWLLLKFQARTAKIAEDVTQELSARENRFRKLFEGNNSIAYLLDPRNGHIEDANDTAAAFWGYEREALQQMNISQIVLDPREQVLQSMARTLEGKESRQQWKHLLRSGEVRDVDVVAGVVTYRNEAMLYCIAYDITDRKQAELALVTESHKNQMLLRTASDGIHILDPQGNVLQVNDAFCRMLGYSLDEMLTMNVAQWDARWAATEIVGMIQQLLASGQGQFFETLHRRKDGSIIDVEISAIGVRIDGKPMIYASARDITQRKQAEKALRESEALNSSVLDSLSEHIAVLDAEGNIIAVNEAWQQFAQANGAPDHSSFIGLNYLQLFHAAPNYPHGEGALDVESGIRTVLSGQSREYTVEYPCHSPAERRWFRLHVTPLQGPRMGAVLTHENITERREREDALRLAGTVFSTVDEGVVVSDADNTIVAVNPAFSHITGYFAEEVVGRNLRVLRSGSQPDVFYRNLWKTLLESGSWSGEITNRRKDGSLYTEWLSIKLVRDEKGSIRHYVGVFSDITERKATEEHVRHLAHFDLLTDLPNRSLLIDRLQQSLAQARRDKSMLALMFLDLDRFKPVNDTLGHEIGDLLLKEVAHRLESCVQRESDTVSRIGGDEFVILLPYIEEEQDAAVVAGKVLHALSRPFLISQNQIDISSSIGIALYPLHGDDSRLLLKNADIAMYHAKQSGRNNYQFFTEHMLEPAQRG